jgi:uncharacterized protein
VQTPDRRKDTALAFRRAWRKPIGILAFVCVILFMFRWFEHSQVFQPYRGALHTSGAALGRPWEDVAFEAKDGTALNGWFFPAATNRPYGTYALLFCHGNAGNICHRLESYDVLLETGINVFGFDYRGYGVSSGRPSEEGTYQDAVAAYEWLIRKGFSSEKILVWGESLGGAVATELGVRVPIGGVILQSTFTSVPALGAELFPFLPVKLICRIRYDTLAKLPRLRVPVMVLHSKVDSIVGINHGEQLFAAAKEPKLFQSLSGDHNDSWRDNPDEFRGGLLQFLQLVTRHHGRGP